MKQQGNLDCDICVRVGGIEPPSNPWEGLILPLNHTRKIQLIISFYLCRLRNTHSTTKYTRSLKNITLF